MNSFKKWSGAWAIPLAVAALAYTANAVVPVVKVVPWVPSDPLIPHDTYAGKSVTLKGTTDVTGNNFEYLWDFGDGNITAQTAVTDNYVLEARHSYAGALNTIFTARLTVRDKTTGESASKPYYLIMRDKQLDYEVNVAIDEGLWYLHKTQSRYLSGVQELGNWKVSKYGGADYSYWCSVGAANINAFEVSGHLASGGAEDPYTETVARGLRWLFTELGPVNIGLQNNGIGNNLNPDSNGNGIGLYTTQGYEFYQGGMVIDAIVASGTPNAVATTGGATVVGRTYAQIIQDMVDAYAWAQYDGSPGGGWRYSANQFPDNSACQWAAIGMIAAQREWGLIMPAWVKEWNVPWLAATQNKTTGLFGYTDGNAVWGPYATTPSGMVQMVLDGIGRGMTGPGGWPDWDKAETFMRNNFGNSGGAGNAVKDYYYGMFSFVKSMLLHDANGDGFPDPIVLLQSKTPGVPPIDWYRAEASAGAPTDGVARTLIGDQSTYASGGAYWFGHNYTGDQYYFETAWSIMMLKQKIDKAGGPVAVAKAIPNPGVVGQTITLDGSDSYHTAPGRVIDSWQWDLNADGIWDASGPQITTTYAALGNYPVKLRVTDDATPEQAAETIVVVRIDTPPIAPTADAGGPYVFCPQAKPWFLDGLASNNPDEGQSEPGKPGDTIQTYAWDLDGNGVFDDAVGPTPNVTAWFEAKGPGEYLIQLRVTDTTAKSFPSSGFGNLSSTASTAVYVLVSANPDCACVVLGVDVVGKKVNLSWNALAGVSSYNIYRGTIAGGPYLWIDNTTGTTYTDNSGISGTTYYYVVRPAALNGDEFCQSNEVQAKPECDPPVASAAPTQEVSNSARYYRKLSATSGCYGRMQLSLWVGDTASGLKAGPFPNGSVVRISKSAKESVKPGAYGVAAFITVKGQAQVWASDPLGQEGAKALVP